MTLPFLEGGGKRGTAARSTDGGRASRSHSCSCSPTPAPDLDLDRAPAPDLDPHPHPDTAQKVKIASYW